MGTDRFISFSKEHPCPSIEDVETALRSYVTEAGVLTRHSPTLVSVKLVGRSSIIASAFPGNEWLNGMSEKLKAVNSERHVEVDITGGQMDVITRRGDEFTSALANGFVEFAVRYWGGVAEEM
jgi:hypothetical protein